jgi:hypothetical protein
MRLGYSGNGFCPFGCACGRATFRLISCQGCGSAGASVTAAGITERYRVAGTRAVGSAAAIEDAGGGVAVHAALQARAQAPFRVGIEPQAVLPNWRR